jgi:hypothetical protein
MRLMAEFNASIDSIVSVCSSNSLCNLIGSTWGTFDDDSSDTSITMSDGVAGHASDGLHPASLECGGVAGVLICNKYGWTLHQHRFWYGQQIAMTGNLIRRYVTLCCRVALSLYLASRFQNIPLLFLFRFIGDSVRP